MLKKMVKYAEKLIFFFENLVLRCGRPPGLDSRALPLMSHSVSHSSTHSLPLTADVVYGWPLICYPG